MSRRYILEHYDDIKAYACVIEDRQDDSYCTMDLLLRDNEHMLELARKLGVEYILLDNEYKVDISL